MINKLKNRILELEKEILDEDTRHFEPQRTMRMEAELKILKEWLKDKLSYEETLERTRKDVLQKIEFRIKTILGFDEYEGRLPKNSEELAETIAEYFEDLKKELEK